MFPDAARAAWSPPPPPERQSQPGWFPLSDAVLIGAAPPDAYSEEPQQPPHPALLPPADAYGRVQFGEVATYATWPPDARLEHFESHRAPMYQPQQEHQVYYESPPQEDAYPDHHQYQYQQQQQSHSYHQHDEQQLQFQQQALLPPPPPRRKSQEPAIGRWNAEEHKLFLKGLEMFQGPAWGEIARIIGSRTSTQVRTHAQKFFTKLARTGQSLPYFAAQIQKERSRLLTQQATAVSDDGAAAATGSDGGGGTSVTPTSTSGFNFALSSLSPNKRVGSSSVPGTGPLAPVPTGAALKQDSEYGSYSNTVGGESSAYLDAASHEIATSSNNSADDDSYVHSTSAPTGDENEAGEARDGGAGSYYHPPPDDELFRPKFEGEALSPLLLRKPRVHIDGAMSMAAIPAITLPPAMAAAAGIPGVGGGAGDPAYGDVPSQQHQMHPSEPFSGVVYPSSLQPSRRDSFDASRLHYLGAAGDGEQQQQQQQSYSYGPSHIQHQQPHLSLPYQHNQSQHFSHPQRSQLFAEDPQSGTGTNSSNNNNTSSFVVASASAFASDSWGGDGVSPRQWLSATHLDGTSPVDTESLPSMNKLLFRSSSSSSV